MYSQVGIGTTDVAPSALLQLESTTRTFVPTRINTAQMNAIVNPMEGSIVFNSTRETPFVYINGVWVELIGNRTPTLLLRRAGDVFPTSLTNEFQLPVNATHILENDPTTFTVNSSGKITILQSGVYLFSVTLSTTNIASGNRKFYLKLYKNNIVRGILSSISFTMPATPVTDFWGGNGSVVIDAAVNDVFDLRYFLNESVNKTIAIISCSITKIK